jgi:predicted dehydrogenase
MNVGIIGCGNIAPAYFNSHKLYNNFKVTACADIVHEVAKKSAEEHNVKAQTVDEILLNDDISLIINLTVPSAHKEIIMRSLESGKHCYSEKPLTINFLSNLEV